MTTGYTLSVDPPRFWETACESGGYLFSAKDWQNVLKKGFSARTIYAWNRAQDSGVAFTLFPAGPFHVAYLGFPAGAYLGAAPDHETLLEVWRRNRRIRPPACVRVPVSGFDSSSPLHYPFAETPETAITELQSWDIGDASNNVRRDLKKAHAAKVTVMEPVEPDLADTIYDIYHDTIRRHKGSLRYTRPYFRNLVQLSREDSRLRVSVALVEGETSAFNVAAIDGPRAYYLHGGIKLDASSTRPGAVLMESAIRWAQDSGCASFNFMSSPADQVSLVRYKEKWGGETRTHRTYTIGMSAAYPLFRAAEKLYRLVS